MALKTLVTALKGSLPDDSHMYIYKRLHVGTQTSHAKQSAPIYACQRVYSIPLNDLTDFPNDESVYCQSVFHTHALFQPSHQTLFLAVNFSRHAFTCKLNTPLKLSWAFMFSRYDGEWKLCDCFMPAFYKCSICYSHNVTTVCCSNAREANKLQKEGREDSGKKGTLRQRVWDGIVWVV